MTTSPSSAACWLANSFNAPKLGLPFGSVGSSGRMTKNFGTYDGVKLAWQCARSMSGVTRSTHVRALTNATSSEGSFVATTAAISKAGRKTPPTTGPASVR
eukprot:CAMPEP_0170422074 /NCGR_PEP_ID=MMETSP0117_2-20130122/36241_1 /TAXON_ID=400756 /ORGANISM="Durinskia baltica, Strain CSIRO CS-38" /LENGTH=100 /DNA_ID=CAMNT_0010680673 /DNA_START=244 /DNA_END=542 /DNA_ORIENTATION=+